MPKPATLSIAALLLFCAVTASAQAADPAPRSKQAESSAAERAKFTGAGLNHERQAGLLDKNHDGKITFAEFTASQARQFAKLDANKDGVLTIQEMSASATMRQAEVSRKISEMRARSKERAAAKQ